MSKKDELKKILIEDYGYAETDLTEDGKPLTNAKLELLIERERSESEQLVVEKVVVEKEDEIDSFFDKGVYKKETQLFNDNDLIDVMSGINGMLVHHSKETGKDYRFNGFGQVKKMEYKELINIRNLNPETLDDCWLVVLNKDIITDFGFEEKYKNILTPKNIKTILTKEPEEVKSFIEHLPEGMKVTIVDTAREMYRGGKLDRKSIIDVIQNTFDISLEDNAPLSATIEIK